jgi:hypothetical protein
MEFHPISELDARMKPETLAKAHRLAEHDNIGIQLDALREKYGVKYSVREGVKQKDLTSFHLTQHTVSKLGNNMRLSTLLDYVQSLDMKVEIIAQRREENAEKVVLLKTI